MDHATMASPEIIKAVYDILRASLGPGDILVIDEDHLHVGHGAGGAHLALIANCPIFKGMALLPRHRAIMSACAPLFSSGELHALRIESANAPDSA